MRWRAHLGLILSATAAMAQSIVSARAGLISFIQGPVFVDERPAKITQKTPLQMKDGQTLRTGRSRAEVALSPVIMLRLNNTTSVTLKNTRLADTQIVLDRGSAYVEVLAM